MLQCMSVNFRAYVKFFVEGLLFIGGFCTAGTERFFWTTKIEI